MVLSSIYHRPDSEFAYMYDQENVHIRLKTERGGAKQVNLVYFDPFRTRNLKDFQNILMNKIESTSYHDYYQVTVQMPTHRLGYGFMIQLADDSLYWYGDLGLDKLEQKLPTEEELNRMNFFRLPYLHFSDQFTGPEWVKDTIWYQIFPDRFLNSDSNLNPPKIKKWDHHSQPKYHDFYGGDLAGITSQLDYLADLGITGIYLCPIFKAQTNHKYDTIDYFEVDPHFGSLEDLKRLVEEAHRRGIRIMLDAVFNHIGVQSKQWQDVVNNGNHSKYYHWFHINQLPVDHYYPINEYEYNYETFAFAENLPKLNTLNPEVQDYLLSVGKYWIDECDIDGWRLDVANEVDHHFWKKFRAKMEEEKSDIFILGEVWHQSHQWLQGDEFHSVMNYPLNFSVRDYFVFQMVSAQEFLDRLAEHRMLYPDSVNQFRFNLLDSHDTARMITILNGNKELLRQVFAFLFIQQGTPCIYYGTEVGLWGGDDPDCRRPMIWNPAEQDQDLLMFFKELIQFRKEYNQVIQYGERMEVAENQKDVITVTISNELSEIVAIFNRGQSSYHHQLSGEIILSNLADENNLASFGFLIILTRQERIYG